VKNAQQVFESIGKPDVTSYTAMSESIICSSLSFFFVFLFEVNAFGLNRMGLESVDLYRKMPTNLRDEVTHICVLNACSHSGLLNEAYCIFNEISDKTKNIYNTMVCLVDLFSFFC
jgi:pentatricopeptide repeat protein